MLFHSESLAGSFHRGTTMVIGGPLLFDIITSKDPYKLVLPKRSIPPNTPIKWIKRLGSTGKPLSPPPAGGDVFH